MNDKDIGENLSLFQTFILNIDPSKISLDSLNYLHWISVMGF